jgi:hypothetical protein
LTGLFHVPVIIVDKVTETGCVHDSKAETDAILLDVCMNKMFSVGVATAYIRRMITSTYALNGDSLGPFSIRSERLLGGIKSGVEEGVD